MTPADLDAIEARAFVPLNLNAEPSDHLAAATHDRLALCAALREAWRERDSWRLQAECEATCSGVLTEQAENAWAEVRRLRGLIKQVEAEASGERAFKANCPWCNYAVGDFKRRHSPECSAFTESGDVR